MANELKLGDPVVVGSLSADPVTGLDGEIYYNTSSGIIRIYQNGSWQDISSFSFANQTLSNLTSPTSVNQNLLPSVDNTYTLGSSTGNKWQWGYIDNNQTNQVTSAAGTDLSLNTTFNGGGGALRLYASGQAVLWAQGSANVTILGPRLELSSNTNISYSGGAPSINTGGSNLGTGGSVTATNVARGCGQLTLSTGTGSASGYQAMVNIGTAGLAAYTNPPVITLTPNNAVAASIQAYVITSTTTFTIYFAGTPADSTDYLFSYSVVESINTNSTVYPV